jgi:hypothetical protein
MSQATEHYVATVEEKLYPEEPPNPTKLYDRYSLPLSRARYLARVLLARRSAAWRKGARAELLARLNEKKADAETAIQQKKFSQEFDCILSRPAFEELQVFYEQARRHQKRLVSSSRRRSFPASDRRSRFRSDASSFS